MKAAVYEGKEMLTVQERDIPTIQSGELLLKIHSCCVCGTDLRTYRNGDKKIAPGRILGHEFYGEIVESAITEDQPGDLKVGDRVVMYIVIPCGKCRYCLAGMPNLCINRTTISYQHDGAFAEYMRVPAACVDRGHVYKIDPEIETSRLCVAEPLGCVINAHGRLNVGLKDKVAIIGAGPIGVMHGLVSRFSGAQEVYMLDTSANRLKITETFGFDNYIQVDKDGNHFEKINELTDGFGPSVVIVACSSPYAQADALEMAGKAARVEFFGGLPKSNPFATLNTNHLHYKELLVTGSYSEKKSDFEASLALVTNPAFPADKIVTHRLPLDRITDAFGLMETGESLKVRIDVA